MLRTKGTKNFLSLPTEILPRFTRQNDKPASIRERLRLCCEFGYSKE